MKKILYMAMSVNGYIARENGEEDFLSHENWQSLCDLAKECDCMVVGRKAFEVVQSWGEEYSYDSIVGVQKVVVSKNENFVAGKNYIVANSPMDAIKKMESKGFKNMLITGGANINSSFMKEGLIDEIFINVEPFVLGNGIPLFSKEEFDHKLNFLDIKKIKDGILQLHYEVLK